MRSDVTDSGVSEDNVASNSWNTLWRHTSRAYPSPPSNSNVDCLQMSRATPSPPPPSSCGDCTLEYSRVFRVMLLFVCLMFVGLESCGLQGTWIWSCVDLKRILSCGDLKWCGSGVMWMWIKLKGIWSYMDFVSYEFGMRFVAMWMWGRVYLMIQFMLNPKHVDFESCETQGILICDKCGFQVCGGQIWTHIGCPGMWIGSHVDFKYGDLESICILVWSDVDLRKCEFGLKWIWIHVDFVKCFCDGKWHFLRVSGDFWGVFRQFSAILDLMWIWNECGFRVMWSWIHIEGPGTWNWSHVDFMYVDLGSICSQAWRDVDFGKCGFSIISYLNLCGFWVGGILIRNVFLHFDLRFMQFTAAQTQSSSKSVNLVDYGGCNFTPPPFAALRRVVKGGRGAYLFIDTCVRNVILLLFIFV